MGAIRYFYHLQPTTYQLYLLVAKRVHRFAVHISEFHNLISGTPQRVRTTEIDAPYVPFKIGIVPMYGDTPIIIEILHHEAFACTGERFEREEHGLTSRECIHILDTGRIPKGEGPIE